MAKLIIDSEEGFIEIHKMPEGDSFATSEIMRGPYTEDGIEDAIIRFKIEEQRESDMVKELAQKLEVEESSD